MKKNEMTTGLTSHRIAHVEVGGIFDDTQL
jgi:hypothetical protein